MATEKKKRQQQGLGCVVLLLIAAAFLIPAAQRDQEAREAAMKTPQRSEPGYVNREAYGDTWAFTVDDGVIECRPGDRVVFVHGEAVYAMNGLALGAADSEGWKRIHEIWRDNPAGPGPKVDLSPFITLGLNLCK